MEPRTICHRTRLGFAVGRARDRGAASARAARTPEGHGGSRDDSRGPRAAERHLRCHRSPLSILAGHPTHAQGSALVTTLGITINSRAYGPMDVRDDLT